MFSWFRKKVSKGEGRRQLEIVPKDDYNVIRYVRLYSTLEQEEIIRKRLNQILENYLELCANKQNVFHRNKRKIIFHWSGKSGVSLIIWLLRVYLSIETTQAYTLMKTDPDSVPHVFFPAEIDSGDTAYWAKWEMIVTWKFSNKHVLRVIEKEPQRINISFRMSTNECYYLEWISLRRDSAAGDIVITISEERIRAHSQVLGNRVTELSDEIYKFAVQVCLEFLYLGYISDWDRFGPDEKREIEKVARIWSLNRVLELCHLN